ncbi:hypothetical protein DL95DRAFT_412815 [Leptodontidium sp. 2 PMI_412]|nr:hypothetical protein DL95DRAFT_412815 [Leptodontidium sp. 2 PMI_412]
MRKRAAHSSGKPVAVFGPAPVIVETRAALLFEDNKDDEGDDHDYENEDDECFGYLQEWDRRPGLRPDPGTGRDPWIFTSAVGIRKWQLRFQSADPDAVAISWFWFRWLSWLGHEGTVRARQNHTSGTVH